MGLSPNLPMCTQDGYDFASAYLASQQQEGRVVGAVTLLTDGGDRHITTNKVR